MGRSTAANARGHAHSRGRRHLFTPTCMAALTVLLVGCASSGTATSRRTNTVITQDELTAVDMPSAYDAVQRLRPQWLRGRGASSLRDPKPALPVVYIAGVRHGGLDALRIVRIAETNEIRFISASDATTRWGTGHMGGVIEVILR